MMAESNWILVKVCCRNMTIYVMQPGHPIVDELSALADFFFSCCVETINGTFVTI